MGSTWDVRCPAPHGLVRPVPVDPQGVAGPTMGQAKGPRWRRSSPRLYVPAAVDRALVEQRILEESQVLPPGGLVTGWAALRLAGGGYFDGRDPRDLSDLPVPLLVPADRKIRARPGILVVLRRNPGTHGIRLGRSALALADQRSRPPQEVDLRLIWQLDAGLPRPRMNWPVADDDGRYSASRTCCAPS